MSSVLPIPAHPRRGRTGTPRPLRAPGRPDLVAAIGRLALVARALADLHATGFVLGEISPSTLRWSAAGCLNFDPVHSQRIAVAPPIVDALTPPDGLLHLASPERLIGWKLDPRSDAYGLGLVLYEQLTGRAPYPEALDDDLRQVRRIVLGAGRVPVRAHAPTTPRPLAELADALVARHRNRRPGCLRAVADQLEGCLSGARTIARAPEVAPAPAPIDLRGGERWLWAASDTDCEAALDALAEETCAALDLHPPLLIRIEAEAESRATEGMVVAWMRAAAAHLGIPPGREGGSLVALVRRLAARRALTLQIHRVDRLHRAALEWIRGLAAAAPLTVHWSGLTPHLPSR